MHLSIAAGAGIAALPPAPRLIADTEEALQEPEWRWDVRTKNTDNVMNNNTGTFGILIGGVVAVVAVLFILSGGELGGKKTVDGDQDLPPVATADR